MRYQGKVVVLVAICVSLMAVAPSFAYSLSEEQALYAKRDWNALLDYGLGWTRAEPNNSNAWGTLAIAYYNLNRPDLALAPAQRGVALTPKDAGAWTLLGFIYKKLNRYTEEVDALRHPVDLAPHNATFWNNLAAAYGDEGSNVLLLKTLEQQAQIAGPYMDYVGWHNLGSGFLNAAESGHFRGVALGRDPLAVTQEAAYAYKQTLRLNPRDAVAWTNLGVAEEILGAANPNALNDYQRGASLGDPFGRENYNRLQQAIAAARIPSPLASCAQQWAHNIYTPQCGRHVPGADWPRVRVGAILIAAG